MSVNKNKPNIIPVPGIIIIINLYPIIIIITYLDEHV